ncbi:MAG: 3-phosphoglycerate dehydrogenase [Proteobacteria bacterium]|nr:3-phosphoglycerate dehydrogenase [Pseudomonadota bacterium]
MPHILIAGKIHDGGLAIVKSAPGVTFDYVSDPDPAAYLPYLPKAEGLLLRTQPLTAAHIATAPKLAIVSRHGVGYDAVDVAALNARKVPLAIVGDVNSRAVAEHSLMLMLAALRRTVFYDQASRNGNWTARNAFDAQELDGKSVLVIGFGRIGRRVGQLVQAFGASVLAHDPLMKPEDIAAAGATPAPDLKQALSAADVVTLHMPGAKGAVIGATELAVMKPSATIINAARGGLVDEAALDAALRARRLFAAGLDVLVDEPPKAGHPLLSNPYLTISPHNAGLTTECARRMAIVSAQNILDHFAAKLDRKLAVNADVVFG